MFGIKRRATPAASKAFPMLTNEDFYADVRNNTIIITVKENCSLFAGDTIYLDVAIAPTQLVNGRIYGDEKKFKGVEG